MVAIEDIGIDDDEDDKDGLALLLLTCNEAAKPDPAVAVSFLLPASLLAVMYTPVLFWRARSLLLELLIAASLLGVTTSFLRTVVLGMVVFGEYAAGNVLTDGGPGDRPGAGSPLVVRPPYASMTSDVNIANSNRLKFMMILLPLFG